MPNPPLLIVPRSRGPTHVVVRGPDAVAANLAGHVVAAALDPEFALLEIRSRSGAALPGSIDWGDRVPADRHLVTLAPDAQGDGGGPGLLDAWPIVRVDHPEEVLSHLAEFLAAPEASEQTLRRRFPIRRPMAILIANGWVVARQFPDEPAITGRLMEVQKKFGVSVILVTDLAPRHDLVVFDAVFDVIASDAQGESARLRCARAPSDADYRAGDELLVDVRRTVTRLSGLPASVPPSAAAPASSEAVPEGSRGAATASAKL
ncbi:MAG: hypothetical protein L3K18_02885 [Thermoplasmata archaeon]|nr:hypothetical protein [Thermoplasmata archaeon]